MTPRLAAVIDEFEHEIETAERYRRSRDVGGQHVGTGGRLSNAPVSVLIRLRRYVEDLRAAANAD